MSGVRKKRLVRCLCFAALAGAVCCALLFLDLHVFHLQLCPFRRITGHSCPGCGNTRAAAALAHGRFAESLRYNYLYPLEYAYLIYVTVSAGVRYVLHGKFSYQPRFPAADYALLGLMLAWWIVRNVLGV